MAPDRRDARETSMASRPNMLVPLVGMILLALLCLNVLPVAAGFFSSWGKAGPSGGYVQPFEMGR